MCADATKTEVNQVKHIRTIAKAKQPQMAASIIKAIKEDKKPPVNATMSL